MMKGELQRQRRTHSTARCVTHSRMLTRCIPVGCCMQLTHLCRLVRLPTLAKAADTTSQPAAFSSHDASSHQVPSSTTSSSQSSITHGVRALLVALLFCFCAL